MNNEIKEILECLKKEDNYWSKQEHNYAFPDYYSLNREDLHLLLDYITKLQEDIRTGQEINSELQQENERLKQDYINLRNYIKMRNVSTEVEDKALLYNIELENINKKKYLEYKTRCEKAVEYINTHDDSFYQEKGLNENSLNNLLNILQNGSEENEC